MKKMKVLLISISILISIIVGVFYLKKSAISEARRSLPSSAVEIQENYKGEVLPGDFALLLKARLPKEDFVTYAQNLKLTEQYDPAKINQDNDRQIITTTIDRAPSWWMKRKVFRIAIIDIPRVKII